MNRHLKNYLRRWKKRLFPPPLNISDEYINRLFCAVPGMVERGNLRAYQYAFERIPDDVAVIEIGSYAGQSTNAMLYYLELNKRNNPVFSCDTWEYVGERDDLPPDPEYLNRVGPRRKLSRETYMAFVKESFIRNTLAFNPENLPGSFHLSSDEFFVQWAEQQTLTDVFGKVRDLGGPIGFCFIDGHHEYEYARRDWENADRYLISGGFILLDDSADHLSSGRHRLAREKLQDGNYEFVFKNPNYLFRKR